MLLALGGAPDYNLVLWVWEKSKAAAVTKATNQQQAAVHSCAFSPGDSSVVSVVGSGIFKMFKVWGRGSWVSAGGGAPAPASCMVQQVQSSM
eukprot:363208-Chlamydomonas_euryale.AAC.2